MCKITDEELVAEYSTIRRFDSIRFDCPKVHSYLCVKHYVEG